MGAAPDAKAEAIRKIQAAGFGQFEATSALEKSGGDPSKALELLATGWSPAQAVPSASAPPLADSARCPFSGAQATSQQRCPFTSPQPAAAAPTASPSPI